MGNTVRLADVYSLPNLFKNGGFETKDISFWVCENYTPSIITEEVTSEFGCRTYGKVSLTNDNSFNIVQQFDNSGAGLLDYDGKKRIDIGANTSLVSDQSICLCTVSSGVAVKVVGGSVGIFGVFCEKDYVVPPVAGGLPNAYNYKYVELSNDFFSTDWVRLTCNYTPTRYLCLVGFKFEKRSGSPDIYFGNMQLVEGEYSDIRYTGCLFSDSMPRNCCVLSMGVVAPEGFDILYPSDDFFIRIGKESEDEVGGSISHVHTYKQNMVDDETKAQTDSPYRRALISDKHAASTPEEKNNTTLTDSTIQIDNGAINHEHKVSNQCNIDNSVPNWRGYLICRKK